MSSSPTAATSTTASSSSLPSAPEEARDEASRSGRVALVACGALAQPAASIAAATGWPLDVHPLPPLLHNSPREIAPQVRTLVERLTPSYDRVVVGYADCGTYGALDDVCAELGVTRMDGLHCYDVYAGSATIERLMAEQPAPTCSPTSWCARSRARWSRSWGSTAGRSCGTTTSATTRA